MEMSDWSSDVCSSDLGSIINAPANKPVHFYHATAKEFLTGPPLGDENDREFFFKDMKGGFLALPLLKVLNHNLKRNMANTADSIPLGKGRWIDFKTLPKHIAYAARYWSTHLDLSSASEEVWGEPHLFLTTKLLFWLELSPPKPFHLFVSNLLGLLINIQLIHNSS